MALSQQQTHVARKIIAQGQAQNAPRHVIRVALAAALTEANLLNPQHGDADSVGPFQERTSQGWGSPEQLRSVRYQAKQFFDRAIPLFNRGVKGGALAQAVERSAYPGRYAPNLGTAGSILRGLGAHMAGTVPEAPGTTPQKVTPAAAQVPTRVQIPTITLPNPLPTNLPIAGPTLPAGSIGSQSQAVARRAQAQTPTGQRAPQVPTAPAAAPQTMQQPQQQAPGKQGKIPVAQPQQVAPSEAVQGFRRVKLAAKALEHMHLPYTWGGGHSASGQPAPGLDCSGAVRWVLDHAGVHTPSMVASQFKSFGKPGPGAVTIYASDSHVFMKIGNKFFGTSRTNPGGGAGFFPSGIQDLSLYTVRHIAGLDHGGVARVAHAANAQLSAGEHPDAGTVKITKGIHTNTPRFSSVPILSDLTQQQPQTDVLAKSREPHVPLSIRKIGAGRKKPRAPKIRLGA